MASAGGHWVKGSFVPAGRSARESEPGYGGDVEGVLNDEATKAAMAAAANAVLDDWEQDEEGFSDEFGGGGACDSVCQAYNGVLMDRLPGTVDLLEGGHAGDDHAYSIVYDQESGRAWEVDIPPQVYETGGGYSWSKIPGAKVRTSDIVISEIAGFDMEEYGYGY